MRLLTNKGTDIRISNKNGWSTIHFAYEGGSHQTVDFLLNNREVPNVTDNNRFSVLHTAAQNGHLEIVKLLIKRLAGVPHQGSDQNTSISENFCNNIDIPDNLNYTPLFCAASDGHKDMVQILLSHSSVNIKDRYKATPLFAAMRNGHEDMVKQLTSLNKQKSKFKDSFGQNLLWWAIGTEKNTIINIVSKFT